MDINNLKQDIKDYINGMDSIPWEETVDEDIDKIFLENR